MTAAPDRVKERIYAAFDIHVFYLAKTSTKSPSELPSTPSTRPPSPPYSTTPHQRRHPPRHPGPAATSTDPLAQLIPPP